MFLLFLLAHTISGCNSQPKTYGQVTRSFYYWKSVFNLSTEQRTELKLLHIKRLYVKLFDVNWNTEHNIAVPVAPIKFENPCPDEIDLVPVIYITNKTFVNLPDSMVSALADSIYQKMQSILSASGQNRTPAEIQFDCDWTATTANKFFGFLQIFRKKVSPAQIQLSATIRLHQVKYSKQTGIPPVDRGMLMLYNTGNFKDPQTQNAILDLAEARRYLQTLNRYPLPTDVALPLFSWGVVFRNGQFVNLINQLNTHTANNQPQLLQPLGNNRYLALKSGAINGSQVGKNDQIRVEEIQPAVAVRTAKWVSRNIGTTGNINVAMYHLNPNLFEQYPPPKIETIFNIFQP